MQICKQLSRKEFFFNVDGKGRKLKWEKFITISLSETVSFEATKSRERERVQFPCNDLASISISGTMRAPSISFSINSRNENDNSLIMIKRLQTYKSSHFRQHFFREYPRLQFTVRRNHLSRSCLWPQARSHLLLT